MAHPNPAFPNEYTLRTVAEVSSKPCIVCHKPTTKVLTTVGNKDFLYTCASHLSDRGFASPVVDEKGEAARKKAEELAKEKESVIKEFEERMKKRKKKGKEKEKDKEKKEDEVDEEKEKDEKLKAIDAKAAADAPGGDDGPREFTLHRNFYQMRLDRRANIEKARRDQARLQDPSFFPSAPKGDIA